MRHCHQILIVAGALLTGFSFLQAANPTYPIKLHRADTVGETYADHVTVEAKVSRTMTSPNVPAKTEEQTIKGDLAGQVHIVAVDPKGEPATFTITVGKFTGGAEGKELVASGEIISIARTEKDVTATLKDKTPPSAEALEVIRAIYHPLPKSGLTDDDTMGSQTPRAVGESWPINAENAAKDASNNGAVVDAKNLSGKTTLKGVEKNNGVEALRIVSEVNGKNITPNGLPPGFTAGDCHMEGRDEGLFPTDLSLPPAESHMLLDMTMNATTDGGATSIKAVVHVEITEKISLSK